EIETGLEFRRVLFRSALSTDASRLLLDAGDLQHGQGLTVTPAALVSGLVLVVHPADLRATNVLDDLCVHGDVFQLVAGGQIRAKIGTASCKGTVGINV